jgi:hypothetical protein
MAEKQVPFDTNNEPAFQNCAQLAIGMECATSTCGGSIPAKLARRFEVNFKCGAAIPTAAPVPTAKPTEIDRTGSPTVVGGSGSPTLAFTLSPTVTTPAPGASSASPTTIPSAAPTTSPNATPTTKGDLDVSGASNLLPSVAVALGVVVALVY